MIDPSEQEAAQVSAKRAAIAADVAIVKTAAAAGSTAAQQRAGFAAMLRLLKLITPDIKD